MRITEVNMSFCKVTSDLNKHLSDLDKNDDRQQAIEEEQAEVYTDLLGGQLVWIGNDNYSIDDFISDCDIDSTYLCRFILGDSDDLRASINVRLNKFAEKLATKIIDSGV